MNYKTQIKKRKIPTTHEFAKTLFDNYNQISRCTNCENLTIGHSTEPSIYFITTKFNNVSGGSDDALGNKKSFNGPYAETEERIQIVNEWQYRFWQHTRNQCVSNSHYRSKERLIPFALCLIDFPNSRKHQPRITEMPHFHSLFVIPAEIKEKFDVLAYDDFRVNRYLNKTRTLQGVPHCEHINAEKQNVMKVIDYSSKFLRHPLVSHFSNETQLTLSEIYGAGLVKKSLISKYPTF